jgi:ribosomal protein S18 acetylase RimI-like enzyme
MIIKEITSEFDSTYKAFFTKGLVDYEDNFRISPNDEENEPFPTLDKEDSFTLASLAPDGEWMGVVSFKTELANREKCAHKGLLFRMYVAREFSGMGVGFRLVQELISRVESIGRFEQIKLTVVSTNISAKSLYEKFGFLEYGLEKESIKWGDKYLDEVLMVKFLK